MQKTVSFLIAALAVAVTVGAVLFSNRAVPPHQATMEDVRAEARAGGYRLIATDDLAALYRKDPGGFLLVDTRQEWEYRTGHMKGAGNFPMEPTRWSRLRSAGALEAYLGPDKNRLVVFY